MERSKFESNNEVISACSGCLVLAVQLADKQYCATEYSKSETPFRSQHMTSEVLYRMSLSHVPYYN